MVLSKSEKTKLVILEAAAQVLSKQADATLNDIAEAASVGRATLHRHFSSREDLIKSLALKAIDDVQDIARPAIEDAASSKEALANLVEVLVPLGHKYRFLATDPISYSDPEVSAKYNQHLTRLSDLAMGLKAENEIADDIPIAWVVAVIDALIYAAWFTLEDGYIAKRDAAPLAIRSILGGLR